jgi:hypothetical protein
VREEKPVSTKKQPEAKPAQPVSRPITLMELIQVIQEVAETDSEAAATLASMLRSGRIQRLTEEALAA